MTISQCFHRWASPFNRRLGRALPLGLVVLLSLSGAALAMSSGDKTGASSTEKDKASNTTGSAKTDASTAKPAALTADDQIRLLNEKVERLEEIIDRLEKKVDGPQGQSNLGAAVAASPVGVEPAGSAPTTTPSTIATSASSASASSASASGKGQGDQAESPLQLKIGKAYITPVGFADFTMVFRSTNTGNGIGTNFGSIPFSTTTQGRLTETKFSGQNSRIGFRVDANVHGAHVLGYMESDFLGAAPGNFQVTSNSNAQRMRVYWIDVRKDKWEILGGQSWSMMTPGRNGISGIPGDIFYAQNMDTNYQLGLVWSRAAQFRLIYHPTKTIAWGFAVENPDQYIGGSGGGGVITIPAAFASSYSSQLDSGGGGTSVPNLHPDFQTKLALDPMVGGKHQHIEFAGVVRSFKALNPIVGKSSTTTGGGGSVNLNLEVFKNFHLISNNYWSAGGGRYIFGLAPDVVVRGDGTLSLVDSGSTVDGFEATIHNSLLYGYYGGVYIDRNTVIDPSSGKPVGYGFPGSPSSNNRVLHEATFGLTQTLWKDPKWGALQLITQYSYVLRHPWAVSTGAPSDAHTNMFFFDLRFSLPGNPPKESELMGK